jgi:hypothetical protein
MSKDYFITIQYSYTLFNHPHTFTILPSHLHHISHLNTFNFLLHPSQNVASFSIQNLSKYSYIWS